MHDKELERLRRLCEFLKQPDASGSCDMASTRTEIISKVPELIAEIKRLKIKVDELEG